MSNDKGDVYVAPKSLKTLTLHAVSEIEPEAVPSVEMTFDEKGVIVFIEMELPMEKSAIQSISGIQKAVKETIANYTDVVVKGVIVTVTEMCKA